MDDAGQNAIVLVGGANPRYRATTDVDAALAARCRDDWLLVQNETSGVATPSAAPKRGLRVAFNPAPFDATC